MLDTAQLGEKIRLYRKQKGLTQADLAELLHVSFQAISSWECGNTLPDIENLCRLAEIFGMSLDQMLQKRSVTDEPAVIGIHGNGSGCEFVLATQSGRIFKRVRLPGTNASVIGTETALSILCHGIDLCLAELPTVQGVLIGNSGSHRDELLAGLCERYPQIEIRATGVTATLFSCAKGDVVLICDEGSGLSVKERDGGSRGFGGYGYVFGDPCSAYSLGRAAIRLALAYEDGAGGSPVTYSLLQKRQGITKIRGAFSNAPVAQIARQADVLIEAYLAGDPAAERVLCVEAQELSEQILAACRIAEGNRVIVSGDLIEKHHELLLPLLERYVGQDVEFIRLAVPPVYGTCKEAFHSYGIKPKKGFVKRFLREYSALDE